MRHLNKGCCLYIIAEVSNRKNYSIVIFISKELKEDMSTDYQLKEDIKDHKTRGTKTYFQYLEENTNFKKQIFNKQKIINRIGGTSGTKCLFRGVY